MRKLAFLFLLLLVVCPFGNALGQQSSGSKVQSKVRKDLILPRR